MNSEKRKVCLTFYLGIAYTECINGKFTLHFAEGERL